MAMTVMNASFMGSGRAFPAGVSLFWVEGHFLASEFAETALRTSNFFYIYKREDTWERR